MEEAGVEVRIMNKLGSFQYFWYRETWKIMIDTQLFLMEYLKTVVINPEGRQVNFFKLRRF